MSSQKRKDVHLSVKKEVKQKTIHKETTEKCNRIKELEREVHSLQIENTFLKELRKLRKQEA
ncbi:hypothetical protein TEHD23766T_1296 [Tetragenococcus halophilus subsp. flandriensis]|nr:hypothetical protein TEHD23766T_1296 [Tetragenococcus halophilus subsp. flandriensis]